MQPSPPSETDSTGVDQILAANHPDPFGFLGLHFSENKEAIFRVFNPLAKNVVIILDDDAGELELTKTRGEGFFEGVKPDLKERTGYQVKWTDFDFKEHDP